MSASRRGGPVNLRKSGAQLGGGTTSKDKQLLPPLNDNSFSEQYKTFKALGGFNRGKINQLEMSKDLRMKINPSAMNKPYFRRSIKGPPTMGGGMDPARHLMMNYPAPGMGGPLDQSVFQTNASHVLSSPNNTFNFMGDATTAANNAQLSMMRNAQFANQGKQPSAPPLTAVPPCADVMVMSQ